MVRCGRGTQLLGETLRRRGMRETTVRRRFQGVGSDFEEGVRFREGEGEGGPLLVVGTRRLYDMYADCKTCTQTVRHVRRLQIQSISPLPTVARVRRVDASE